MPVEAGYIEFVDPPLDDAIDALVARGITDVVAVPLVLLGAGHLKDDGPAALLQARRRHPVVTFSYARELGVHPAVLAAVEDRVREATGLLTTGRGSPDAVVVVGRGSSDPDANADLVKAARLLADGRHLTAQLDGKEPTVDRTDGPAALGTVEPAFVSLARPGVNSALDRCHRLGARRIVVVPYFLFHGLLVDRIAEQVRAWNDDHPDTEVVCGRQMGIDARLVGLTWARYDELAHGEVSMNCDGCLYRTPLPGYANRVGMPLPVDRRR